MVGEVQFGCLRRILVGLSFLWSVSYIKSIPTQEKVICCGEKSVPNAAFNVIFLGWGGLGLLRSLSVS